MPHVADLNYSLTKDFGFILEAESKNLDELSALTGISRTTFYEIKAGKKVSLQVCEKFYSFVYKAGYTLNTVKEDFLNESTKDLVLFHGSKSGLKNISESGSRENCDFGSGFYLGENYLQALAFVCENPCSSVYSFTCDPDGLKTLRFDCDLEWMLAICNYRGTIKKYSDSPQVKRILEKVDDADVIIAPIADNRMFYIMSLFAEGDINADVAIHSLSASKIGRQYVFKTAKAIEKLIPVERYYLSGPEKADCRELLRSRAAEIDTKLKLSRREYRNGLFIEEILK